MTSEIGTEESIGDTKMLMKMVGKAKENHFEVRTERLLGEGEIKTNTDVSFGTVKEGRSRVGFVVGIRDERRGKCLIYWKSRRGQRVTRSTLEAEAITLNEGLEMALQIQEMG